MTTKYSLQEAFKQFDLLEEEDFNLNSDEVDAADEFMSAADALEVLDVIDPEADSEEDLQSKYEGEGILRCKICKIPVFKPISEIKYDEDKHVVNVEDECPYCHSTDGFEVYGKVAPFDDTEYDVTVEPKEEDEANDDNEILPEGCDCENTVNEALENIDIETEHDKIHVQAEEKGETGDEMLAPLEPDEIDEIENSGESEEDIPMDDMQATDDTVDYDFDDFDEGSFDTMGESYLKSVYDNVNSYKTTNVSMKGDKLVVEGKINFKSGSTKNTKFIFEAADATKRGKVRFIGENLAITDNHKAFKLVGNIQDKKFIGESFNYDYKQADDTGKKVKVYGTIKNKR